MLTSTRRQQCHERIIYFGPEIRLGPSHSHLGQDVALGTLGLVLGMSLAKRLLSSSPDVTSGRAATGCWLALEPSRCRAIHLELSRAVSRASSGGPCATGCAINMINGRSYLFGRRQVGREGGGEGQRENSDWISSWSARASVNKWLCFASQLQLSAPADRIWLSREPPGESLATSGRPYRRPPLGLMKCH